MRATQSGRPSRGNFAEAHEPARGRARRGAARRARRSASRHRRRTRRPPTSAAPNDPGELVEERDHVRERDEVERAVRERQRRRVAPARSRTRSASSGGILRARLVDHRAARSTPTTSASGNRRGDRETPPRRCPCRRRATRRGASGTASSPASKPARCVAAPARVPRSARAARTAARSGRAEEPPEQRPAHDDVGGEARELPPARASPAYAFDAIRSFLAGLRTPNIAAALPYVDRDRDVPVGVLVEDDVARRARPRTCGPRRRSSARAPSSSSTCRARARPRPARGASRVEVELRRCRSGRRTSTVARIRLVADLAARAGRAGRARRGRSAARAPPASTAAREVGGRGREEVAAVERARDGLERVRRGSRARAPSAMPPVAVGRRQAAGRCRGRRRAARPRRAARARGARRRRPGSTTARWTPTGMYGERVREHERALEHVPRRDPVRDVDDLDVGSDRA